MAKSSNVSPQPTIKERVAELQGKKSVYFLLKKNPELHNMFDLRTNQHIPTPPYPPSFTIPNMTTIVWPGGKDMFGEEREAGLHMIRYYVGATNLFVDRQPKEQSIIEQFMRNPANQFEFIHGRYEVWGSDKMRKMFMDVSSYNNDSDTRNTSVVAFYKTYNEATEKAAQGKRLKLQKDALDMASEASDKQVLFHAAILGISLVDWDTQAERDLEMIKIDYQQTAMDNPEYFIDTFDKQELKASAWIKEAMDSGQISYEIVAGKATWVKSNIEICPVPPRAKRDEVMGLLLNFATSKEGEGFMKHLSTIFE